MFYFIGGAPRVGKTIIAKKLADKLKLSWLSTDTLRGVVRKTGNFLPDHPINALLNKGEEDNQEEFYRDNSSWRTINLQNTESKFVADIVKVFIQESSFLERNFIVEGVALWPPFFDHEWLDNNAVQFYCVGNTEIKTFSEYSWKNRGPGDWLEKADRKTFERVIRYCADFSKLFHQEAQKKQIPYFEISSPTFEKDIDQVVERIAGS